VRSELPEVTGHQHPLDGLRAVAAFMVLLFHVAANTGYLVRQDTPLSWLLSRGEIGVPIFFALSGLLLFRPWALRILEDAPTPRLGSYARKRGLRVLPAYWVVVVAAILLHSREHLTDLWSWVSLLTLTYSYDPHPWWGGYLGPDGLGQIWSLTVEVAWYALLPATGLLLLRLAGTGPIGTRYRRLMYGLTGYAVISLAYTVVMFHTSDEQLVSVWLPRYLIWFAAGMAMSAVAVYARHHAPTARWTRTIAESWGMWWIAAALFYCLASTPLTGVSRMLSVSVWPAEFHLGLYGMVAVCLIAPVAFAPAGHPAISAVLGNRVMAFLGKISYGVFLWQFVVISVWFTVTDHPAYTGNLLVDFPVCALLTVGVATASYHLIEQPFVRLGTRAKPRAEGGEHGDARELRKQLS
jgi:peptidoglycan/LPS O-acetylase OafA/YrhL